MAAPAAARVEIGYVARAHGIRGEIVIVTHEAEADDLGGAEVIYLNGVERTIEVARYTHRGWLVRLAGVATRNDAELLKGRKVELEREALELEDDDVLLADLVGCACKRADGTPWGTVAEVIPGDLQDLLVIHDGDVERLLPLVDVFVTEIDVDARVLTVEPPEGLPETKR